MYSKTTINVLPNNNILPDVRPETCGSLFLKYRCELNDNCVHLLVKIAKKKPSMY
jgi:hypothetical protein